MIKLKYLIAESPDQLDVDGKTYTYTEKRTQSWIWSPSHRTMTVGKSGESHADMRNSGILDKVLLPDGFKHSGRIFYQPKVITFWTNTKPAEIKKIVKELEKEIGLKFFNKNYRIEINLPKEGRTIISLDDYVK